jgi:hypothetical protein
LLPDHCEFLNREGASSTERLRKKSATYFLSLCLDDFEAEAEKPMLGCDFGAEVEKGKIYIVHERIQFIEIPVVFCSYID